MFRHEPYSITVDTYSFSMILYQLFEHHPPFAGTDPVTACRQAAMENKRPTLQRLLENNTVIKVLALNWVDTAANVKVCKSCCSRRPALQWPFGASSVSTAARRRRQDKVPLHVLPSA